MKIVCALLITLFVASCSFDMEKEVIKNKSSFGSRCLYNRDCSSEFTAPCDWYDVGDKIDKYKTLADSLSKKK